MSNELLEEQAGTMERVGPMKECGDRAIRHQHQQKAIYWSAGAPTPFPLKERPGLRCGAPAQLAASVAYLQPGVFTVWPGGWHFAPPSFGPLLLLPGPKSGSATAGATGMPRAPTHRRAAKSLRLRIVAPLFDVRALTRLSPRGRCPR